MGFDPTMIFITQKICCRLIFIFYLHTVILNEHIRQHQDINHKNWLMDTNTIISMRREKITGCYLKDITDDKS